ncbi:MAG: hypothetical protein QOD26_1048 [Betaproteobacteria bacterium]|jgi:hypothetical protein|nr:hypothetical protein [Betaproteobacteria bacterium]
MAGPLRVVVLFLALACTQAGAQIDPNFQALLNALMRGSEVALLTPLPDGTVEITSFIAPGQRSAVEAATLIERARLNLVNFGIEQPTGQQLALALAGGNIQVPSGSTQIAGVLPQGTAGMRTSSQLVAAGSLPTIVGTSPAGVGAAAGGTAPTAATTPNGGLAGLTPAQQTQALQSAHNQLAALGIVNPTPQQLAAALNGGNVVTPGGTSMLLPGLISR